MIEYTSSIDARSRVVHEALGHVGHDVGRIALARAQRRKTRVQARPGNWSGPFALMVLLDAGLCEWTWRPGLGFCYKLQRIESTELEPGDMVFFDRPPRDEVIEAEAAENEPDSATAPESLVWVQRGDVVPVDVNGPNDAAPSDAEQPGQSEPLLKTIRTHGKATAARPPSSDGPHYGIVADVLPTGDLRIIKGAHNNRVAVLSVRRETVNASYSLRPLVAGFDPAPEPGPEPAPEPESAPEPEPEPEPEPVIASSGQPTESDWEEPDTAPDLPEHRSSTPDSVERDED